MTDLEHRLSWVEQIMGMPISIHLRGSGIRREHDVTAAVATAYERLREADLLFSTYRADSQVSALNRGELKVRQCDPLVREVVELCHLAWESTDGYFDTRLRTVGGRRIFDPSGLVKGWAVERAAAVLATVKDTDYYVNAGGDIAVGVRPDSPRGWRIGVENPCDSQQILTFREISAGGVATSGTAARGLHILDPRSGTPADELLAVTVIGPRLLWADVFATAAFARGTDAVSWLRERAPDYEAIAVR